MNKPDLWFRLESTFLECLKQAIEHQMNEPGGDDDDRLYLSSLWEVRNKISVKLAADIRNQYKLKLTPAQGYALRILYSSASGADLWFMNELRKIADKVHQTYA